MDRSKRKSIRRTVTIAPRVALEPTQQSTQQPDAAGDIPTVYLSKLMKPDFQPEDYLKETLKTVQEKNIRLFRKALEDSRKVASKNLQKNVYKNYESFVFISKEISSMERDMQLLRELLHNINQVGDDLMDEDEQAILEAEETPAARFGRRRTMRMSMANQQDLFKDQLTKVWRTIQDAQKFVPFAPNRHVVGEAKSINELSPSTLQIRQKVDIVVLNDMLLLAVRRKRGNYSQTASVADRSFAMSDITVTDVGDSPRVSNLVKIVNRAETFLFGFRTNDAKKEFLLLISHAKSGIFGPEPVPMLPIPPVPPIKDGASSVRTAKSALSTGAGEEDQEGMAESVKARVDEMLDALDIHIARREFNEATVLVQRLVKCLDESPKSASSTRKAVETHVAELARLVLADLLIPCSPRKQVAANVSLLHRLGWDKEAKEAFLASRSSTIKNRTRQLKLEGNTRLYIRELAVVYFRLIRNTCEWYSEFFKDPTMISALIAWVRQEMAGYAVIFRRHVFHEMQKFQVIASCLSHTLVEVEILGHAGLDLKFMLDQEFFPDLTNCICSYETRCLSMLNKAVAEDSFAVASKISTASNENAARIFGPQIPIIASVSKLDEILSDFGNELRFIVRDSLYGQVVASVLSIIEGVLKQFLNVLRKGALSYAQEFALLASTQAVVSWVIPRSASHLDRIFGRTVTDIHNLEQRLEAFPASLQDVFCQKHAVAIAKATFDFVTTDFGVDGQVEDSMAPSAEMERLLSALGETARELDGWPLPKRSILGGIIDCMFVQMIEHRNWETAKGEKRVFSRFGVHRLVLDVHFLLRVCGSLVSKSTNNMANRVCEKALRACIHGSTGKSPAEVAKTMKDRQWYDARVMMAMKRLGFGFPEFGKGFEHRAQQSFEAATDAAAVGSSAGGSAPGSSRAATASPATTSSTKS